MFGQLFRNMPEVVKNLLIINVLFFIGQSILPAIDIKDPKAFIETCIEDIKKDNQHFEQPYQNLAWSIAKGYALSRLKKLTNEEMTHLMDCLFSCKSPALNAHGYTIISEFSDDEISQKFK